MTEYVMAGVDGSDSALAATRWAAREAARRGVDLRLVHVRQLPLLLPPSDLYARELTDLGNKWLGAARDAALAVAPDIDVHTGLRSGVPGAELVAETEDAALVVVGSRGLGGFRSLLLGSVANVLAAHAHCPVVVLRGRTEGAAPPETGPVVVGADGTPTSARAVEFALATAAARDAEVIAVHAWTNEGHVDTRSPASLSTHRDESTWARQRAFDQWFGALCTAHPEVSVRRVHFHGRPVDGILEQAAAAQLIVVGVNGRHPVLAGATGSTTYAVLHHATCPVAVSGRASRHDHTRVRRSATTPGAAGGRSPSPG